MIWRYSDTLLIVTNKNFWHDLQIVKTVVLQRYFFAEAESDWLGADSEDIFDPGAGDSGKLKVVQFGTIFRKTRNVAFREQKVVWK